MPVQKKSGTLLNAPHTYRGRYEISVNQLFILLLQDCYRANSKYLIMSASIYVFQLQGVCKASSFLFLWPYPFSTFFILLWRHLIILSSIYFFNYRVFIRHFFLFLLRSYLLLTWVSLVQFGPFSTSQP